MRGSIPIDSFPFDPWDRQIDFDSALGAVKSYVSKCDLEHWFPVLADHTFRSDWFRLDTKEIHAMRSRFAKESFSTAILGALAAKIDDMIRSRFSSDGCFVRLSTRSPKDAVVSSPMFVEMLLRRLESLAPDDWMQAGVAFYECVMECGRMRSGEAAVDLLCNSSRVFLDLKRAEDAGFAVNCVVREYCFLPPSSEFRAFVVHGKITAVSQYIDCLYFPELDANVIRSILLAFQDAVLLKHASELPQAFVADLSIDFSTGSCKIIELNPFYFKTGAALFNWDRDKEILLSGDCVIRLASESEAAASAKREFQGIREEMRELEKRQHKPVDESSEKKCVIN